MSEHHGKHARPKASRGTADDSLPARVSHALRWSFASTLFTRLSTFAVNVILSRILGPHAFGAFAVALVALFAMQTFNDLGIGMAIIRWEKDPAEIVPTVMTTSVVVSALAYAVCFFLAPVYAAAMGAPAATNLVRLVGVSLLIDGFINTANALLQRNLRARQRTIALQSGWLGTILTIVLASTGHGAMSLAIGQVSGTAITGMLYLVFAPESLRFGYDREKARQLLGFGLPLAGSNIIAFAAGSADQVIVGHLLGPVALGFFVLASNLAGWPLSMFTRPVRHVLPAALSRLQGNKAALRTAFLNAAGVLLAVALPVCALIGGSAKPLIGFVYGSHWVPAAQAVIWLAVLNGGRILIELAYDYLVVVARTRFLLVGQVVWLAAVVPSLIVGSKGAGIYGAALGESAVVILVVVPIYLLGLRSEAISFSGIAKQGCLPAAGAVITWLAGAQAPDFISNRAAALLVSGAAAMVVIAFLVYLKRATLAALRSAAPEAALAPPRPAASSAEHAGALKPRTPQTHTDRLKAANLRPEVVLSRRRPYSRQALRPESVAGAFGTSAFAAGVPIYGDPLMGAPVWQDLAVTSPLYRVTVDSQLWDPLSSSGDHTRLRGRDRNRSISEDVAPTRFRWRDLPGIGG